MVRILYAEDNPDNVYMLVRRLTRRGFEVIVAADGAEAVARAHADAPALILMDLSLPVLDGWEATRQLKADPATRGIPIVALTAHAMANDREEALAMGCDEFEIKPVDLARLVGKIEMLLGKGSSR